MFKAAPDGIDVIPVAADHWHCAPRPASLRRSVIQGVVLAMLTLVVAAELLLR